jgi:hypothetical protein
MSRQTYHHPYWDQSFAEKRAIFAELIYEIVCENTKFKKISLEHCLTEIL